MVSLQKKFKVLTLISIVVSMAVFIVHSQQTTMASSKRPVVKPNRACSFLKGMDMPTKIYENTGEKGPYGEYEADSFSFVLETRNPDRFKNNLTYSVFGDKSAAKAVELCLNVNDLSFSSNAVSELIKYSDYLMFKVTGKNLTPEMKTAMRKKVKGEWIVNGYKIKLKKEVFPDEKPIEGVESTSDHGAFSLTFLIEL